MIGLNGLLFYYIEKDFPLKNHKRIILYDFMVLILFLIFFEFIIPILLRVLHFQVLFYIDSDAVRRFLLKIIIY